MPQEISTPVGMICFKQRVDTTAVGVTRPGISAKKGWLICLTPEGFGGQARRGSPWRSSTSASGAAPWRPAPKVSLPRRPAITPRRCARRPGRGRCVRNPQPSSILLRLRCCIMMEFTLLRGRKSRPCREIANPQTAWKTTAADSASRISTVPQQEGDQAGHR